MTLVAVLVYLLAIAFPVYLLYQFHAARWYWHILAIAAAFALGFVPTPAGWKSSTFDMLFGAAFILLMVWGVGGLFVIRPHHEKHA